MVQNRVLKSIFLAGAGLTALASGAAAQSATNGADAFLTVDKIIVTAQRREEAFIDVPLSVRAFGQDELRARQVDSSEEIFGAVVNAAISRTRNVGSEWNIVIRGVSDAAALNVDSSVGVYIDDVFVADSSGFNFEFYDLAALEVLRGPQGVLYGRNSLGGAVNVRLAAPGETLGGRATALYGSDNEVRAGAAIDLPSKNGRFRTRISGLYARHDARLENRFPGAADADSLDAYGIRIKSEYDLTDSTLIQFGADYADTDRLLGVGTFDTVAEEGINSFQPGVSSLENGGASLRITHNAGSVVLRSITAYRETDGTSTGARPETILRNLNDADVHHKSWTQEFQIRSNADGPLTWTAGLFGQFGTTNRVSSVDNVDFGVSERSLAEIKNDSLAIYGEGRWAMSPALALSFGGRFTADHKELDYQHTGDFSPLFGFPFAPAQTIVQDERYSDFTPRVTLEFTPTDAITAYAKASRGYKAGGFNTEFVTAARVDFDKETLWNYEAGVKTAFLDGRGVVSAAAFYTDWRNQQALIFENGQSFVASADESKTIGFELETYLNPVAGLSFTAGVGYADATFEVFENADLSGANANGNRQPRAPEWTGAFSIAHEIPLTSQLNGFYRADYTFTGDFFWDALNTLKEDERHLLDLSIGFRAGGVMAQVFAKNVLDEDYNLQAFPSVPGFFESQAAPAEGRTFGVRMSYDY